MSPADQAAEVVADGGDDLIEPGAKQILLVPVVPVAAPRPSSKS